MQTVLNRLSLFVMALVLAMSLSACSDKDQQPTGGGDAELNPMYSQKADMLEAALRENPKDSTILINLGNLYYDWGQEEANTKGAAAQPLGKWQKAIDYYARALDIDPNNVNIRVDRANLLQWTGRADEAIAEFRKGMSIDPKHQQARVNLILALGQEKQDYNGALKEYDALLKVAPEQAKNESLKAEVDRFKELLKGVGKVNAEDFRQTMKGAGK